MSGRNVWEKVREHVEKRQNSWKWNQENEMKNFGSIQGSDDNQERWVGTTREKGNAPINENPVGGGGGECRQGVGIWQILKFFDLTPQGGKRKVNQKCQKSPHLRGTNLNKQYYNTI